MPSVISPSSFMTGNAPGGANYAAPLVNFQQLAQLPEDYYRGTQEARTLALQNAFPNGLPTVKDANGNDVLDRNGQPQIDVQAASNTLARLGGAEAAQALLPQLIRRQSARDAANIAAGGTPDYTGTGAPAPALVPFPPAQPSPPPTYGKGGPNASPANIVSNQPQQPQLSSTGGDERGSPADKVPDTIQSLATEIFPRPPGQDQDVVRLITAYSSRTGIKPDDDLTPQQAQDFTSWVGRVKLAGQMGGPPARPAQAPVQNEDPSSSGAPTSGTSAQDRQINGVSAAPIPGGGTSGAPAPPSGPGGANPATAAARAITPGPNMGPQLARAQQLRSQAANLRSAAQYLDSQFGAGSGAAYLAQAADVEKQANELTEQLAKGAALSPEVQQAEIAKDAEQKRQAGLIAAGQKQYEGISGNARLYETQQKGWLDTARSLFSQPELYTGVGSSMSQFINRVKAAYANDQAKGAEYQAVLGKVNAASILNTINAQKNDMLESGTNAGRIFAGQIDQAEKTSPGVENTLEANRALIELQTRVGKANSEFARQAREYLKTHSYLDPAFDEKLSKWVEQHPLLSPAEISNPSLLGVAYVPPNRNTPEKVINWAHAMGLKEGDPIRTSEGRLVSVPRIRVPVPVQVPVQAQGVPAANAATPPQGMPTP